LQGGIGKIVHVNNHKIVVQKSGLHALSDWHLCCVAISLCLDLTQLIVEDMVTRLRDEELLPCT
jgi:hypothetical protein